MQAERTSCPAADQRGHEAAQPSAKIAPMTVAWQRVLVTVLTALSLAIIAPDFTLAWSHLGSFGMQFAADGKIVDVFDRSSAAGAGIRTGDRVDLAATPLLSRRWVETGEALAPEGTTARFVIARDGRSRDVTLSAARASRSVADDVSNAVLIASWLVFLAIAGALCYLRPSRMTWAFFWYAFVSCVPSVVVVPTAAPFAGFVAFTVATTCQAAAGLFLVLFALRFPGDVAVGWRRRAEVVTWSAIGAVLAFSVYLSLKELFAPDGFIIAADSVLGGIQIASTIAAAATFAVTYRQAQGMDRARIRWVLVGLGVGQTGLLAFQIIAQVPPLTIAVPVWAINYDLALLLAIPLTIAYSIARHRIFDVRIVVSRALVYALITAGIVVALALVEVVVGKVLARSQLAAILEVVVSVAIGVTLSGVHKRLERSVDAVLYRRRGIAERRLNRLSAGIVHASSATSVAETIVRETSDALGLTSAAFFRRGDAAYRRVAAFGWDDAALAPLNADAPAVLQLRAEHSPLRLSDATWVGLPLPLGERRPVLAVPIGVRGAVEAIAFFGPHQSGEDLDGKEVGMLVALLRATGEALDHIATGAVIERMRRLEQELALLRQAHETAQSPREPTTS